MSPQFHPFPRLTTKRLVLRKPETEDLDSIFFLRSDSEVLRYINQPAAVNMEEIEVFLRGINADMAANKILFWAISLNPGIEMIGVVTLWNFSEDLKTAEIGYSLKPKYHNRGIISEAVQAVLKFGFEKLNFQSIEAFTNWRNAPSIQMLLKNGFTHLEDRADSGDPENIVFGIDRMDFKAQK